MKRNKERKCVKSLFFCIVLFCIIFMVFVGCASQEQERELDVSLDTMEEPLTSYKKRVSLLLKTQRINQIVEFT